MNIGVILAGGLSRRFGKVHKQYLKLNGKEMVSYAITRMRDCKNIDKVILVVDEDEYVTHYIENKYNIECVCGGATRNDSISNALNYIDEHYNCNIVLFHDVTRPLIKSDYYEKCIDGMSGYDCVVSYNEITDSLFNVDNRFVNRDNYRLIQTPEVFNFSQLKECFDNNSKETTIVAQLNNPKINFIKSDKFGFKITYPNDLFLAEQLDKINFYELSKDHERGDITNKTVLVFGATGGVGSAIVDRLKKMNGIEILAPSIQDINLREFTVESLANYCKDNVPDIVINAAAVSKNDDDGLLEAFDDVFTINLKSNLVIIEYLKQLNKESRFVTMSSSSSTKGREKITNYSAAKAALNSIVESQARVLKEKNIYINAVVPEKINTPMIQKIHKTNISSRELLDVDEVVDAILHLASCNEYGQLVHIRKGL